MESQILFLKYWQPRSTWTQADIAFAPLGATLAFRAQISSELIKCLGDWQSDAYRSYIHIPVKDRMLAVSRLTSLFRFFYRPCVSLSGNLGRSSLGLMYVIKCKRPCRNSSLFTSTLVLWFCIFAILDKVKFEL